MLVRRSSAPAGHCMCGAGSTRPERACVATRKLVGHQSNPLAGGFAEGRMMSGMVLATEVRRYVTSASNFCRTYSTSHAALTPLLIQLLLHSTNHPAPLEPMLRCAPRHPRHSTRLHDMSALAFGHACPLRPNSSSTFLHFHPIHPRSLDPLDFLSCQATEADDDDERPRLNDSGAGGGDGGGGEASEAAAARRRSARRDATCGLAVGWR